MSIPAGPPLWSTTPMDCYRNLMFALDSAARIDILTDLGIPIVEASGLHMLTPAAVARPAQMTRQAVHQWFGAGPALRLAFARRFAARWRRWTDVRVYFHGPAGLIPDSEPVRGWTRVWLAIEEWALRDPEFADLVTDQEVYEKSLLVRHLQRDIAARHVVAVSVLTATVAPLHGLIRGLRAAQAADRDADRDAHADPDPETDTETPASRRAQRMVSEAAVALADGVVAGSCLTSSKPAEAA